MESEIGRLLNDIASILAQDEDHPLDGTFLYVESEEGMVGVSLFKDLGDQLIYRWTIEGLAEFLIAL